uniref:Uncharacterized protein n=1 Tax=Aliivibrio fischeri TaxID=668 RepID=A0A0H3ZTW3_ALIFS|nr:hypothetical protein [Aliivibrio fischeri]
MIRIKRVKQVNQEQRELTSLRCVALKLPHYHSDNGELARWVSAGCIDASGLMIMKQDLVRG